MFQNNFVCAGKEIFSVIISSAALPQVGWQKMLVELVLPVLHLLSDKYQSAKFIG